MANRIVSQGAYMLSISESEQGALEEHIWTGLAALQTKKDLPDKIVTDIFNGLVAIQKTYQEVFMEEAHNNYPLLIVETLKGFFEKGISETDSYCAFLKTVTKLVEDMMIAISVTYGHMLGTSFHYEISESYDTLLGLEHKISNTLSSN